MLDQGDEGLHLSGCIPGEIVPSELFTQNMSRKNLLFTCTKQNRCITCTNLSRLHLLHIDLDYFSIWLFFSCLLIYCILQPAFILIGDCCRIVRSVHDLSGIFQCLPVADYTHWQCSTEFSIFFFRFFFIPFYIYFFLLLIAWILIFSLLGLVWKRLLSCFPSVLGKQNPSQRGAGVSIQLQAASQAAK